LRKPVFVKEFIVPLEPTCDWRRLAKPPYRLVRNPVGTQLAKSGTVITYMSLIEGS
jgi:hypothetical protein